MVMICRITVILFMAVTYALQCTLCELQYFVPQRIIPVQTFSSNNQRLCCPTYPQQAQTKQVFVWYGTTNGNGQRTAGIFSNVTTSVQQPQQQYQQQSTEPSSQSGIQGFTSSPTQQTSFPVVQGSEQIYQQGNLGPIQVSEPGNDPHYIDQTIGGQNNFGPIQFQPQAGENGAPTGGFQPTNVDRGTINSQFQLVTPDTAAYNNQYQQGNSAAGSYNSPNAGYQAQSSNANVEFTPVPNLIQLQPVTPIPNSYGDENPPANGQYWQTSGQLYNDANTMIPNQSGIGEMGAQNEWITNSPNSPSGSGGSQMQSSTPSNYVIQQQWNNGRGSPGNYEASTQSASNPSIQEQWNGGYSSSNSAGLPPQYYLDTTVQPNNNYMISSSNSATPQPIQETMFPSATPGRNQGATSGSSYIGPNLEASTSGDSRFSVTQPSSALGTTSNSFQYSTQNPISVISPANGIQQTSTLRPYNDGLYSTSPRQPVSESTPLFATSATNYADNINPAYVAPSVYQTARPDSSTQGAQVISTTNSPQIGTGTYGNQGRISPVPTSFGTSTRYGQNANGGYVQPASEAVFGQNFDNAGVAASQNPAVLDSSARVS
ncbi:hypothetical protein RB195_021853 [Necator americanus]|uniref:Uncharacterized protein n=2 Tax=Necator americanus TaxID=51031 RepID=A0ABR1ECX3_NECAM